MKITSVKVYQLHHKLRRPFGVSVSVPFDKTRSTLMIKVETDSGIVGWGECYPVGGARAVIEEDLAPQLIGQNPLKYRPLWRRMWGANFGHASAVSGIDIALADVRGKALGISVAELLGGRMRDKVPAYASAMSYVEGMPPEKAFPEEAAALVKQGFKALKMRIGRLGVKQDVLIAALVREAVGPDIKLAADGNAAYTLGSALDVARELHKLGFQYFEEPLPQAPYYAGYDELTRKSPIVIAGGECIDSRATARLLLERQMFHIVQPDIALCGGIHEALFIAELAALHGVTFIPHCWGGAVLTAATVHLVAAVADPHWGFPTDSPMLEFDQTENPWRKEIVSKPFQIEDGFVAVPTGPGLGIEIDERAVRRFATKPM